MKPSNWSTTLTIACVLAAWGITFFAAVSDCSVQEWVSFECTNFAYPKKAELQSPTSKQSINQELSGKNTGVSVGATLKDPPSSSELKGQFGDFFGVLNALFGALTLVTVYRAYQLQTSQVDDAKTNANKQLHAQQFERYLIEVEAAIASYNRLVGAIVVVDSNLRWESVHGLFHLWKVHMIFPAANQGPAYAGTYKNPLSESTNDSTINLWSPMLRQLDISSVTVDEKWLNSVWIESQIDHLNDDVMLAFKKNIVSNWEKLYAMHRYQLDAVFRSWFHVYLTIATASEFNVDSDAEWRIASRFRAQLSSVELLFLLSNQVLSENPKFPKAIKMSERYAMFDNYTADLDPIATVILKIAKQNNGLINESGFNSSIAKSKQKEKLQTQTNTETRF